MNRNKYLKICKKCRYRIDSYGGPVFELFCFIFKNRHNLVFFDDDDSETKKSLIPVVKFLEKKGIILSREMYEFKSLIKLQVVEKYAQGEKDRYLCWCGDN